MERYWLEPDLAAYRDYLLQRKHLSPSSVQAHLSTVRRRYRELIDSGELKTHVVSILRVDGVAPAEQQSTFRQIEERLSKALDPTVSEVAAPRPKGEPVRLTKSQASELLGLPGLNTLQGIRDTAVIGLILSTGVRAREIRSLTVSDLETTPTGLSILHVPACQGCTERCVPYATPWILPLIRHWLRQADIKNGHMFRAIYKSGKRVRDAGLSLRAVELIVESYPLIIDGNPLSVTPLVLRRTYASQLLRADMSIKTIAEYLGVSTVTAAEYLGAERVGSNAYDEPSFSKNLYDFEASSDETLIIV
jgi:site-specific recombinase XerD